ncbi:hypothetical protein KDL44_08875 [bacterium]|nr:hypothetical protein [bacterium]
MPEMKPSTKLVILAVLAALLISCPGGNTPRESFSVAWNYDTSGYLEVCGCSAHQLGGLPRRASKLDALESAGPVLKLEGAHFFEEAGTFQMMKGRSIVQALDTMGYDGIILGVREAQQGAAELDSLREQTRIPFISANILSGGQPYGSSVETFSIAGNRVAVTAVSQREFATFTLPEGMSIGDPVAALDSALAQSEQADCRIICLEGDNIWLGGMLQKYAGRADLFLTGDRDDLAASLEFANDPPTLNNWKLGRYLGFVSMDPLEQGGYVASGINIPLEEDLADDPQVLAILEEFKGGLKDVFAEIMPFDKDAIYLPPDYCMPCHQDQYDSYMASGHSRARITLENDNQLYNLDCIKCHIVYDPGENELRPINCISCHTNITDMHVYEAMEDPDNVPRPDPPVTSYAYDFCVKCHDEFNSTPFREHWPQYVNRIFHGGDMSSAEQAAVLLGIDITADPPGHAAHAEDEAAAMDPAAH